MRLFFEDSQGNKRFVKDNVTKETVYQDINDYIKELNPDYVVYYMRNWSPEPYHTIYDVGSHTEFFHTYEV